MFFCKKKFFYIFFKLTLFFFVLFTKIMTILHSENCMEKSLIYKIFVPYLGLGLVTAPASIWSQMRKMSERTFSLHMIKKFFNISFEHSVKFTQKLEKSGLNKNEIDLYKYINNCTWKIACGKII
ncbi:hypothetical protein PUN28_019174 [Cardiocondyla obscurior]|uniref:Uncharacterized protein n=1 Tax=Cardiocondyla obscurior TaxID=286306 RepID=A0AAW2EDR0_9HYME